MEKISLFNTRYNPEVPSVRVYDSSEDARLGTTLHVTSKLAQISFKNKDPRIAEWPTGSGTNTLDFTTIDRNGRFYELSRKVNEKNLLKFPELPEDYAASPRQRINTPIMNRVLDNSHVVQIETIERRIQENKVKGGIISKIPKPVDPEPATAKIGPGEYDIERSLRSLRRDSNILKFSVVTREFDLCQDCAKPPMRSHRDFLKDMARGVSPETSPSRVPVPVPVPVDHAHSLALNDSIEKRAKSIVFSKDDRWHHPMYKQEAFVKTSGVKLSPYYDRVFDKRIVFSMADGAERSSGLDGVSTTTSGIDISVDCGPKTSVATAVKRSQVKYSAAFRSKAPMGMTYPVPASGIDIGPGTFSPPPAIQVRSPEKPMPCFLHGRVISFGFIAAPDPPGDILPPVPLKGGQFSKTGEQGGRNVHLMNVAKKKISKIYPKFATKKYGCQ